jgi:hypothetical protein
MQAPATAAAPKKDENRAALAGVPEAASWDGAAKLRHGAAKGMVTLDR